MLFMSIRQTLLLMNVVWEKVFPDDLRESNPGGFKFLQMAHAWKAKSASILQTTTAPAVQKQQNEDDEDAASSAASDVDMDEAES